MNFRQEIAAAFDGAAAAFQISKPISLLRSGELTLMQYKAILREVYFYTREDPQLQALAAIAFRGDDRKLVRQFFGHASSEIGHEQLALNDLAALGEDVSRIPRQYPLPATSALTAFAFYTIQHRSPSGYLGYLYFLEFMPTSQGREYLQALENAGVPKAAMTFLSDHTSIDVAHNKLMERYVETLIRTTADTEAVKYAIHTTGYLYAQMLQAAIDSVTVEPNFWTVDPIEAARID